MAKNSNDRLTRLERAWVLYDVGNSAFTMIACSLIPIWFKELAIGTNPGQITGDQATAYYSISIAVVTIIVAVLGPILGAIADHKDMKKIFFTTTVALGVFGIFCNRNWADVVYPFLRAPHWGEPGGNFLAAARRPSRPSSPAFTAAV